MKPLLSRIFDQFDIEDSECSDVEICNKKNLCEDFMGDLINILTGPEEIICKDVDTREEALRYFLENSDYNLETELIEEIMKTKKVKDLITGQTIHGNRLSKLVGSAEYQKLMDGETVHKWENTRSGRLKEIKLQAV